MWRDPKVDWSADDFFNATDFNRIKNNLIFVRDMAIKMYKEFLLDVVSNDKTYSDYFYADEINRLENNLEKVNRNTFDRDYGNKVIYADNGNTMTYEELNRIERAIADLYDKLNNQKEGRRMLRFNFGKRGGGL